MKFSIKVRETSFSFKDLKTLLAKASVEKSGDVLAGIAAESNLERVAAQMVLADLPLAHFLEELLIPYEEDEVSRLIIDSHDRESFKTLAGFTVGEFREWLLQTDGEVIKSLTKGFTPEMAAAVSKLMRNQDLIAVAQKLEVMTKFNNTIGLKGRFSTRLQPNHPTDDPKGILLSIIDGLLLGSGDAVIGINPVLDNVENGIALVKLMNDVVEKYEIPTQTCLLTHVTNTIEMINRKVPVDLIFQSIGGTEDTNKSFGISLQILREAYQAGNEMGRGKIGNNFMYFETGQGSALSANAHHGIDQQTCEARAYAVARNFNPLLINSVVGFIGPEYLYDGKQINRAALEDHFCAKLLGLPMGCDICYTNHAEADQNDMDSMLTLLAVAGCNFVMGVPGADDIMLNYQSTSFHDALYVRTVLGKKPAPEFEVWLEKMNIFKNNTKVINNNDLFNKLITSSLV